MEFDGAWSVFLDRFQSFLYCRENWNQNNRKSHVNGRMRKITKILKVNKTFLKTFSHNINKPRTSGVRRSEEISAD